MLPFKKVILDQIFDIFDTINNELYVVYLTSELVKRIVLTIYNSKHEKKKSTKLDKIKNKP